jgi:hypothetical protein
MNGRKARWLGSYGIGNQNYLAVTGFGLAHLHGLSKMPNPGAERPLRKVTLNLFEEDCAFLEEHNEAWTVLVRQLVHAEVQQRKRASPLKGLSEGSLHEASNNKTFRRTLGDLDHIGEYDE